VLTPAALRLGLAVTTVGRPALQSLLVSAGRSACPPVIVVVANQSGSSLSVDTGDLPFEVEIVPSSGGASQGRNDAFWVCGTRATSSASRTMTACTRTTSSRRC
jgi:hypothetical protein